MAAKPAKKAAPKKAAPKAPAAKKVEAVIKNGVTQPKEGSASARIWAVAKSLSTPTKPATRADVVAACKKEKINEATAATQYGRWRVFNGIVRAPKAAVPKAPTAKKAPVKAVPKPKAAPKKAAPKAPAKKAAVPPPPAAK